MGIGGDHLDPRQAAGDQVTEERQPAGTVLGGGHVQAEDLAVPVGVDTGRHQGVDTDDPATLTHLQHKSVGGHERERAGVIETPGAELFHVRVELLGHLSLTCDFDSVVMPSDCTSLSIRRVLTPSR